MEYLCDRAASDRATGRAIGVGFCRRSAGSAGWGRGRGRGRGRAGALAKLRNVTLTSLIYQFNLSVIKCKSRSAAPGLGGGDWRGAAWRGGAPSGLSPRLPRTAVLNAGRRGREEKHLGRMGSRWGPWVRTQTGPTRQRRMGPQISH